MGQWSVIPPEHNLLPTSAKNLHKEGANKTENKMPNGDVPDVNRDLGPFEVDQMRDEC
jgi:hypothetical protein